jgi:nucleotide-binding universal stress UspA family protein
MSACADDPGKLAEVVVGIDDTPGGIAALRYAVGLARSQAAQLIAVRCWELGLPRHGGRRYPPSRHRMLAPSYTGTVARDAANEVVKRVFRDAFGGVPGDVAVRVETPQGDPGATLVSLASRDNDMLVVGTRPGHPLNKVIHGSVAAYCCRYHHSACGVVVVPPDGLAGARHLPTRKA